MNMISLALQGPPNLLRPPSTQPLQARAPIVESPIIHTQSGAISLASLQPPLLTAPPLQPRPATTGSLDLMLPLQPKLLPGYNLQSSYLSNTLSTVRPPDFDKEKEFKPKVEIIVEKVESIDSDSRDSENNCVDSVCKDEVNNVIDSRTTNNYRDNENSPNNNS
uniref:Uncharacterized protein n=2 Tax=Bombyx mori TaxID=7091 RepID=A0A8R2C544_BOMMO|nr:uncharacterized protein LOC105841377 [Bombyx mori]